MLIERDIGMLIEHTNPVHFNVLVVFQDFWHGLQIEECIICKHWLCIYINTMGRTLVDTPMADFVFLAIVALVCIKH